MTRLAVRHGAINLAQGFPDFPAPAALKSAAAEAIDADINQYAITWGAKPFRDAIAAKYQRTYGMDFDPGARDHGLLRRHRRHDRQPAGGARSRRRGGAVRALLRELRARHTALRRHVALRHAAGAGLDLRPGRTARAPSLRAPRPSSSTRPTIRPGKVFTREELECIAGLCQEFDCLAITDEIYEHILYDGTVHVPIMSLPGMRDRSILVNSMSKTYSVTGWRVGWVLALARPDRFHSQGSRFSDRGGGRSATAGRGDGALPAGRLLHASLDRVCRAPRPHRRPLWKRAGFKCFIPHGAYYVMTDISAFGFADDAAFVRHLITHLGVAAVPGSSFFAHTNRGNQFVRFCFCKKYETLELARQQLYKL